MRILLVTAHPPSPIRVRPYRLALALRERGHEVELAHPVAGDREARDTARLEEEGFATITAPITPARRVGALASGALRREPLQARWAWSPALAREIEGRLLGAGGAVPPEVVHVEHLRGAAYGTRLVERHGAPVAWDAVDCISTLFEAARQNAPTRGARWMATAEIGRTRAHEARLVASFPAIVVTSERDRSSLLALAEPRRAALRAADDPGRVRVVANGVALPPLRPGAHPRDPATLVMTGKMSYHANVAAALRLLRGVMPLVWRRRPEARLVLAGADPAPALRAAARESGSRVTLTGYVEDLGAELERATVAVAPIVYAVGIQNKVLEAMAHGAPVIASPTACAALEARDGHELLVAADDEAFARGVLRLLDDPDLARRLGAAGRAYVERRHGWDAAAAAFESAYAAAVEGARRVPQRVEGAVATGGSG